MDFVLKILVGLALFAGYFALGYAFGMRRRASSSRIGYHNPILQEGTYDLAKAVNALVYEVVIGLLCQCFANAFMHNELHTMEFIKISLPTFGYRLVEDGKTFKLKKI